MSSYSGLLLWLYALVFIFHETIMYIPCFQGTKQFFQHSFFKHQTFITRGFNGHHSRVGLMCYGVTYGRRLSSSKLNSKCRKQWRIQSLCSTSDVQKDTWALFIFILFSEVVGTGLGIAKLGGMKAHLRSFFACLFRTQHFLFYPAFTLSLRFTKLPVVCEGLVGTQLPFPGLFIKQWTIEPKGGKII